MNDTGQLATVPSPTSRAHRYRLNRAGIHNVWQYDDHVFHFAEGRLLLRGRNGAGKSKALEMLLPFLLDGDSRRLDTTGTSRTSLRWLMLDGRATSPTSTASDGAEPGDDPAHEAPEYAELGYLWVEFAARGSDGVQSWRTLGAAISVASPEADPRSLFFVTDRRIGTDLTLLEEGQPLPVERLRDEVGTENCYQGAMAYRARVMRELFGLEDPVRYRNLVHLLYRLRRPTIGERIEAGELVSVLAEALPPMDEAVLDTVSHNLSDLDDARARLAALRSAKEHVDEFLADYRNYLNGTLRARASVVREQLDSYDRRAEELERLEGDLEALIAAESAVQEERDRARRTRDTAAADSATLETSSSAAPEPHPGEQRARHAAVAAYIRTAEAAWVAAEHARTAELHAQERITTGVATVTRQLNALRATHARLRDSAAEAGLHQHHQIPQVEGSTLAPRESVTQVDLEGLERSVEREPVLGIDTITLRNSLADLHDELTKTSAALDERTRVATELRSDCQELRTAERRATALRDEAEWLDSRLEDAGKQEREAMDAVRTASADYATAVRGWASRLRAATSEQRIEEALTALEERTQLPLDEELRVLDPSLPEEITRRAHEIVAPALEELRERRDTAIGEQRELRNELDELAERRGGITDDLAAPAPQWITDRRPDAPGAPLHRAIDFVAGLTPTQRAGLEAALEASGLLSGWLTADGEVVDPHTRDLLLRAGQPAGGSTLLDVLRPKEVPGVSAGTVTALLTSIQLERESPEAGEESTPPAASMVSLDGRWRLGVAGGAHTKADVEYIGEAALTRTRDRQLANLDRRIAIAEALLAEAEERRTEVENQYDRLVETLREVPSGAALVAAWAVADCAGAALAQARDDAAAGNRAAQDARDTELTLRGRIQERAGEHALPASVDELSATLSALTASRAHLAAIYSGLNVLAGHLDEYRSSVATWERLRADRIVAEDARGAAIQDMITVRRDIELSERARGAQPEQIAAAQSELRGRIDDAETRIPELERAAQRARDDRVAAETRRGIAVRERGEQARRALAAGARLYAALGEGKPDPDLLTAAGLAQLDDAGGPLRAYTDLLAAADLEQHDTHDPREQVEALRALTSAVEAALPAEVATDLDDSAILRLHDQLHRRLAGTGSGAGARTELTETSGVKRVRVHDDRGAHDIVGYAARLQETIVEAEEAAILREEEAYERHLLGELAGHLSRQISEARALISTMNEVLSEVTTSQGLGVRLDWQIAPDADEDINAVVPLLERPAEKRTRVETTRLRDALRRCIEAIRRLDPSASQGAQLRAALDYRSWFTFHVYVTDAHQVRAERRLTHRTALSQGEQRVIAYLVLFAAAAAQFGALARRAPHAPRLILLDDAFAKVDEPTHGRLLGLLVELDLDFVLTSERVWGCFPSVPSLHIYECLRDPAAPGIATLHFTWDGQRRRMQGV